MGAIHYRTSLLALGILGSMASAQSVTEQQPSKVLADALINDARIRSRSEKIPTELAANEAEILLQAAVRIDPANLDGWRLLAVASETTDHDDLAREAYRQVMKLDPKNLVAQVRFLELLADDRPLEQQLKLYLAAMEKSSLDPQVRSEIAVRIAQLYLQRGEAPEARKMLLKALELNDVNVRAWQSYCTLEPQPGDIPIKRLRALVSLLLANPYQPDVLLAGAHLSASSGVHDAAADWLMAASEQYVLAGQKIPADVYVDMAIELCIVDRRMDAEPLLAEMLKLQDAPLSASLLSLAIRRENEPGWLEKLRQRMTDSIPKDNAPAAERIAALTDALWAELAYFPEISDAVEARLDALRSLVQPDDKAYLRLFGWRLLRQGKFEEARKVLAPQMETDPVCRLGVSQAALAMGDAAEARNQLLELWRERPQGLLALLTTREARKQNVKLPESSMVNLVRNELGRYSRDKLFVHRQPRELVLISPDRVRRMYNTGDPIVIDIKMTNSSDRALAVGPGGAVSVNITADATTRGVSSQTFMGYAVENAPRTYRLEKGESISVSLRVDQGSLRQWLDSNPTFLTPVSVSVTTNPIRTDDGVIPGLGGQTIFAADFDRVGFNFSSIDQVNKVAGEFSAYNGGMRLLVGALLQATAQTLPDQNPENATTQPAMGPADLKKLLIQIVTDQYKNSSPVMQAWLVRNAPADNVEEIKVLIDAQVNNADPIVRMMSYGHIAATVGKSDKPAAIKTLTALAEKEQDELAARWAHCMIDELSVAPAATQPATTKP